MKNTIKHSIKYSILALGCIFAFSTCQLVEITESAKISRPDLTKSTSGIIVSLKNSMQDVKYVNIYRQEVTNYPLESDSTFPIENIGLVFPSSNDTTFVYKDDLVIKSKKYRYYARLYDEDEGYTLTKWTSGIEAANGIVSDSSDALKYGIGSNTKLIYNSNDKKLTISGTILAPNAIEDFDDKFKPALVFSCANGTQAITFISDTENESPVHNGNEIHLLEILPSSFFNTDLEIKGIVAQYEENDDDDDLQRVIWTGLSSIPVYDTDNRPIANNKIVIEVKYGAQGYDFSSSL